MAKELELAEHYEQLNQVMELYIKGETNPTQLARILGMPRKQVIDYVDEWRSIAANNPDIQARAREAVTAMDKHFDLIIKGLWDVADSTLDDKVRSSTLKSIADVEEKRQNALQKAGLYDDTGVGEELAAAEEQAAQIKTLLSEVAVRYPQTKFYIMEELSRIFGQADRIPEGPGDTIAGELAD